MVHGRGQGGRSEAELSTIWTETLQEGFHAAGKPWPAGLKIDLPFYGDALDAITARSRLPTPDDVVQKGPGQNLAFEQFMQSALDEMQQKGIQNWGWVQAIARAIDKRLTPASDFTIETFLSDVFLYVTRKEVTREIDAIVEARLTNEPTLVIAHSLGSVVAYNVLRRRHRTMDLRGFITVGSPLGLRAISSKLGVAENPAAAVGWTNAYDERDIVALNPLDDEYFPADPAILNHDGVDNDTDNRHGIVGYLDDRQVVLKVAQALG